MKKYLLTCVTVFLILYCSIYTISAEENTYNTMPNEYEEFLENIPDEIAELLPEELFSYDVTSVFNATEKMSDFEYLIHSVLKAVGLELSECIGLLTVLVGVLLLGAVFNSFKKFLTGTSSDIFGFCVRLVLFSAITINAVSILENVQLYFSQLKVLTSSIAPVMGVMYALGGNITQAALNEEMLAIFLAICEYISSSTVVPIFSVCIAFALLDAFSSSINLSAISGMIKKWYTSLLGFVMTILSVALGMQSILAARADNLSMKGVKYVVGNMIPVIGGALSGTLGTVATGIDLIRGTFGVCSIIILLLMLLPTLIKILLFRGVFQVTSATAILIGCDAEGKLLAEIGSLFGYIAATISICASVFVIALGIFARGTVAFL